MKVFLHLRKGASGRQFVTSPAKQIRAGEHKTWEVAKTRPLTIRHKGRFKASILLTPSGGRASPDHPAPDVAARLTGRDAGFVLRYLTWLLAIKLKHQIGGSMFASMKTKAGDRIAILRCESGAPYAALNHQGH